MNNKYKEQWLYRKGNILKHKSNEVDHMLKITEIIGDNYMFCFVVDGIVADKSHGSDFKDIIEKYWELYTVNYNKYWTKLNVS